MMAIKHWLRIPGILRFADRYRKSVLTGVVALLGLAVFLGFFAQDKDRAAVAAALRNPMSVFDARSPGARVGGVLLQTKRRLAATRRAGPAPAVALPPRERVLAMTRSRPLPISGGAPLTQAAPDLALLGQPSALTPVGAVPVLGGAPGFDVPPFTFGESPGFAAGPFNPNGPGNPPGPGTPGQPGTSNPESPGSAVPEPATWLMLVLGLGFVGHTLRRRRALAIASSAS